MISGFVSQNHPQQVARRGALDEVDDRATPADEFAKLYERFDGFTLDVAAAEHNTKCPVFYSRDDDGLTQPWTGRVWCNPPFSDLRAWVEKAWAEWLQPSSLGPDLIVMLVPANRAEAYAALRNQGLTVGDIARRPLRRARRQRRPRHRHQVRRRPSHQQEDRSPARNRTSPHRPAPRKDHPMTTTPVLDLDAEVRSYLELTDQIEQLTIQRAGILARIAQLQVGQHQTSYGVGVTISAPARKFNLSRAWEALTPEQRDLCASPDAKKVKAQLPGVLVEAFMEPGTGAPKVSVK